MTMTLGQSLSICFAKYAKFDGRAPRSEYWWFMLFIVVVSCAAASINDTVYGVVAFGLLLPHLAVASRRLHDLDKSAWWLLLGLVPIANLVVLVWFCMKGSQGPNRFGELSS
jgi:uncharacterized membrane protein YhaH (DUF805 family)